jgi:hypothetical protein
VPVPPVSATHSASPVTESISFNTQLSATELAATPGVASKNFEVAFISVTPLNNIKG